MRWPLLILLALVIVSLAAPLLAPFDPMRTQPEQALRPPGGPHWLGTDFLGRDVLSRVLYGGQRTLTMAGLAALVAVLPGGVAGLLAGSLGGWFDRGAVVAINVTLAIPPLVLALVVLTLVGQGSTRIALAVGLAQVAAFAQVTRTAARSIQAMPYIEGARALGATRWQILWRHMLPNTLPLMLAYGSVTLSYCVINSAALSFLGLTGELGVPDWGVILAEGRLDFRRAPWISIVPGVLIAATVMATNALADGLARQRRRGQVWRSD